MPSTAIIICCCIIAALLLLVLLLRCRSCIRRRRRNYRRNKGQKFWYCSDTTSSRNIDYKRVINGNGASITKLRTATIKPPNLFSWSEPLQSNEPAGQALLDATITHWNRSNAFRKAQVYADQVEEQKRQKVHEYTSAYVTSSPALCRSKPTETDTLRSHLAAGYLEYYKRQGKVQSETNSLTRSPTGSAKRNPTLREISRLTGGLRKPSPVDILACNDSTQSNRVTRSPAETSSTKPDSLTLSNASFSSQSVLCTGPRSRLLSLDSERVFATDEVGSTNAERRPLFSCGSFSELQWQSADNLQTKESPPGTLSDTQPSLRNTSASSAASTESNRAVVTLSIPPVTVATLDGEYSTVLDHETNSGARSFYPNLQATRRPTVCLFSAQKRRHRKGHQRRSHVRDLHLGLTHHQHGSPRSAATLTPVRSVEQSSNYGATLAGPLPQSHSAEAKIWSNMKDGENGRLPYSVSYFSTGSTLSPPQAGIDLPDVYLYPPSMSSIHSARGSMLVAQYRDVPSMYSEGFPTSHSYVSMRDDEFVSNGYENCYSAGMTSNGVHPAQKTQSTILSDNLGVEDTQTTALSYPRTSSSGLTTKEFVPQAFPKNSSFDFGPQTARDRIHRRLSPKELEPPLGLNTLKRALSLNLRPKSPKSLGAELQSIFDKHYEMTGIRMLTVGPTNPPRQSLDSHSGGSDFSIRNKLEKRRQSCSVALEDVNLRLTSGMKAAISALHLDCLCSDELVTKKSTPSVLSSIATATLPCMAPLRSHIPSVTTSAVFQRNLKGASSPMRRSSTIFPKDLSLLTKDKQSTGSTHVSNQQPSMRSIKSSTNLNEVK
ncbi:hypothetical protein CRM22_004586 [Opisthorchis felineus]|uniref:Uncharacterized protein n=1 Tax=Opisthorchis felineus TaxID=147828 RepID=A0A4S2LVE3_OPIFE|nr:hypothetical protein CRM22_004586 [Opisthorchis felineus]